MTSQEQQDKMVERNRFDNQMRWPKVEKYLLGFQKRVEGTFDITAYEKLSASFDTPMIKAVYRESLRIHSQQTREEYIGEMNVEYIFHVEETLDYFLRYAAILCNENPELKPELCGNINEMICAVLLHDSIEDYPREKNEEWNFDTLFEIVIANIRKETEITPESESIIRKYVRLMTKDKSKKDRPERNKEYYHNWYENGDVFGKIMKLADIRNNMETLDETRIDTKDMHQVKSFLGTLQTHMENDDLPESLRNHEYLSYIIMLADSNEIFEKVKRRDSLKRFNRFELEIIRSLYLWSKALGYMLHIEPPKAEPVQLPDGSEYVKPDFFTEEELKLKGMTTILDNVKAGTENPEKLILPSFVLSRIRMQEFMGKTSIHERNIIKAKQCPDAASTQHDLEVLSSQNAPYYELVGDTRRSLTQALAAIVDEALARVYFKHGELKLDEINNELHRVIRRTRCAVTETYEECGMVPPRGKIGPRMGMLINSKRYLKVAV